ncbi:hypothetical protein [Halopiger thermotolerans]
MAESTSSGPFEVTEHDQEFVRTAAVSLGVWLTLTLLAVGVLLVAGDSITSVFL